MTMCVMTVLSVAILHGGILVMEYSCYISRIYI
jgi:hypothetical protein